MDFHKGCFGSIYTTNSGEIKYKANLECVPGTQYILDKSQ